MSNPNPSNHAASAYAKLMNIAGEQKLNFMSLLIRYATERFLYRLSVSESASKFVLKGGNLFVIWQKGQNFRPTVDADLPCLGNTDPEHLKSIFLQAAKNPVSLKDGMRFDMDSFRLDAIREETEYGGTRITFNGFLTAARIPLQFDICVGDAITPPPELMDFPVLLDGPAPRLKAYPMAAAIAEKAEIMISRGIINSRMKDFYDIWLLSELLIMIIPYCAEPSEIPLRGARCHGPPRCRTYTTQFATSPIKSTQWNAFLRKNILHSAPANFSLVITRIAMFLNPVFFPPEDIPEKWVAARGWK
ncbi:MAG: nucleotidyl transferase AbiEii/AbiGii toxin family protein [Oligosphaeraceae bacterium]|nr:nucleotidyl transferase AbiEii/AbiGii toxin family protein [Oligosphaeraceae bacterium]